MKKQEVMNKKGLSSIVATLLIILLVLVAVVIIWVVVSRIVREGSDQIELSKVTLNLEIKKAIAINDSFVKVHVRRNPGKGELAGLSFIFEDAFKSEVIDRNLTLDELEEDIFVILLEVVNVFEIKKISIAPILILRSGKEIIGDIQDDYEINVNGLLCETTCENSGFQCGTQIFCGIRADCGSCGAGFHCPYGFCVADTHIWEGDLISWWNFSADASDTRGNNPGIVHGATLDPNGKSGGEPCYYFDGIDDYIDIGNFSVSGDELTIAAWIRTDALTWPFDPVIISKAHGAALGENIFLMGLNDTTPTRSNFLFEITSGGTSEYINQQNYNLNTGWHFLTYVYNSTHMLVYLDASLVSSTPKTGNLEINDDPVNIGRNPVGDGNGYRYWEGYIDEPMIWGRALTQVEITQIHNDFL